MVAALSGAWLGCYWGWCSPLLNQSHPSNYQQCYLIARTSLIQGQQRLDSIGSTISWYLLETTITWLQHFLGLGWDDTGVGVVHYWYRHVFQTVYSSLEGRQNQHQIGYITCFNWFHPFIVCIRQNMKRSSTLCSLVRMRLGQVLSTRGLYSSVELLSVLYNCNDQL